MIFGKLLQNPIIGGGVLIMAAFIAMICANTGAAPLYYHITEMRFILDKPIFFWVNDVLMTLFFLLIGLEIKRELVMGELSSRSTALQPVFAAIGGVLVPIACFFMFNMGQADTMAGWAVPCATDIAFALGVLALLGARVPSALVILLTAIAIIDDLIAILIISLFYTQDMQWLYLLWAACAAGGLFLLNRRNVQSVAAYIMIGLLLWMAFYKAGLHPTMAGVVTALSLPVRGNKKEVKENKDTKEILPLLRLEHALKPWVIFAIIPLFAFFNAGLDVSLVQWSDFSKPLTAGIIAGLMLGKPVGIMAGLYLGHLCGIAKKPDALHWSHYIGIACLCGIGFTMSLFIGDLGFDDVVYKEQVKLGVLFASACMAITGWLLCRATLKPRTCSPY